MNSRNIYSGNINTKPTVIPSKPAVKDNSKYIATIISENLQKNSIEKPDYDAQRAKLERQKAKKAQLDKRHNIDNVKKVQPDPYLQMSVNYDDYDFNEWNQKIVDTYNPYAIDDINNSTLSNYEKIRRIIKTEQMYDKNFHEFNENLDDIYQDIKEKITNETLKTMYGEDNFEYIENDVSKYKKDWTTGDDEADLLLKLYYSPKIKQRDIPANEYIAQRYSAFAKTVDGKQPFEVEMARTSVNPNDVVRVSLDKPYYMSQEFLNKNKNTQLEYIKTINEKGLANQNRFASKFQTKPPLRPSTSPSFGGNKTPVNGVSGQNTNQNLFTIESLNEGNDQLTGFRTVPRRKEWITPGSEAEIEKRRNEAVASNVNNDNVNVVDNESTLNYNENTINKDVNPSLPMYYAFNQEDFNNPNNELNTDIFENINIDLKDQVEFDVTKKSDSDSSNNTQLSDDIFVQNKEDMISDNQNNKISNNKGFVRFFEANVERINNQENVNDLYSSLNLRNHLQKSKIAQSKDSGILKVSPNQTKSLAEILLEKRNKNHRQMLEASKNRKVSLQQAIDDVNSKSFAAPKSPRKYK